VSPPESLSHRPETRRRLYPASSDETKHGEPVGVAPFDNAAAPLRATDATAGGASAAASATLAPASLEAGPAAAARSTVSDSPYPLAGDVAWFGATPSRDGLSHSMSSVDLANYAAPDGTDTMFSPTHTLHTPSRGLGMSSPNVFGVLSPLTLAQQTPGPPSARNPAPRSARRGSDAAPRGTSSLTAQFIKEAAANANASVSSSSASTGPAVGFHAPVTPPTTQPRVTSRRASAGAEEDKTADQPAATPAAAQATAKPLLPTPDTTLKARNLAESLPLPDGGSPAALLSG